MSGLADLWRQLDALALEPLRKQLRGMGYDLKEGGGHRWIATRIGPWRPWMDREAGTIVSMSAGGLLDGVGAAITEAAQTKAEAERNGEDWADWHPCAGCSDSVPDAMTPFVCFDCMAPLCGDCGMNFEDVLDSLSRCPPCDAIAHANREPTEAA